ncbi:VC0807 family protein [Metabacillus arenae]|uniref:Uncharacterized protein n=1 Tax=Metabacillus arenae TaxID=2771434 RepID=A0A926NC53_9BACI|nr:VC0807 family protein [Metabacillus arenae]MBD1380804.1 hypothetical protein [Metabacillus arenae]
MKKHLIYGDLIFYLALPYLIWRFGQEPLGDYTAMLLTTVPGIFYTIYRFISEKQFNVTGLFILSTMTLGTIIDLMSQSAERMQWNNVYYGVALGLFWLLTILFKKPLAMYFAIDIAYLQGHNRNDSYKLFTIPDLYPSFCWLTALFAIRNFGQAGFKAYLLNTIGIEHYDRILFYMKVYGWTFSVIIFISFLYIANKISKYTDLTIPKS